MRIPKKVVAAMRQYYQNRRLSKEWVGSNHESGKPWDKAADLKAIENALPKNCCYFEACVGTFWLTWRRPRIQTVHSEKNYWTGKVLARFDPKKRAWVKVTKDWA